MDEERNKEKNNEANEEVPTIRTMQTDAQTYIKKKNITPLDIAAKTYAAQSPRLGIKYPHSRWQVYAFSSITLIVVGIAGWWFFLRAPATVPSKLQPKPPTTVVRTEKEVELAFSSANLRPFLDSLEREQAAERPAGSLVYLPVAVGNGETKRYIGAQDFFQALEIKPPQSLVDAIHPTFYLFARRGNERGSLAFVFRARNFERVFSSLLFWERMMPKDLHRLIPSNIVLNTLPRAFSDKIIKNHDSRVLVDPATSKTVLAYTLFDKSFVILTPSEEALATILERMIAVPPQ